MDDFGEGVLTPYPVGPEGKSPFFPVSQVCVCLSVCVCMHACVSLCVCSLAWPDLFSFVLGKKGLATRD